MHTILLDCCDIEEHVECSEVGPDVKDGFRGGGGGGGKNL